jgi:hypothetical protein
MWEKFSIISSLCRVRASSSKRLIESSAPSFYFFFRYGGFLGHAREIIFKRDKLETQLAILYLVGDMHWKKKKKNQEQPGLIPPIRIISSMK